MFQGYQAKDEVAQIILFTVWDWHRLALKCIWCCRNKTELTFHNMNY